MTFTVRYSEFAGFFPGRMDANGIERVVPVLLIQDVYPRSWILTYNHPGSRTNKSNKSGGGGGGGEICCPTLFRSLKLYKIKIFYF